MVNARNKYNNTALMNACRTGDTAMVQLLLGHHADIVIKDNNGDNALTHARRAGSARVVALLANPAGVEKKKK
jgi:ankyrin repeat protein